MEICKQQIEIEMRHLPAISKYGYEGDFRDFSVINR